MVEEKINFSTFYLSEFYNAVDENAKLRLDSKKHAEVKSLLDNLKSEQESSTGVELLAHEHGTSELSIFLYDIIERVNKYPPTVVHDSMPEMVDDFVNTLEVMLEEESTFTALQKVNLQINSPTEFKHEIPETDQIEAHVKEESINFTSFINLEFKTELEKELVKKDKSRDFKNLLEYVNILLENLQNPILFNAPEKLSKIVEDCDQIFVQPNSEINSISVYKNIKNLMPGISNKLLEIEKEYPDHISDSIEQKTLVIKEPLDSAKKEEEASEPVEEKVQMEDTSEDKPSSIENLLSSYFQSEINEYLQIFREGFEALKAEPADISELENLENKFHSFKEISMIHGYEILEASCVKIMQILGKVRTKKHEFTDDFFNYSEKYLNEINKTEKLKGKSQNSAESRVIDSILTEMENAIVLKKKDKKSKKVINEEPDKQEYKEQSDIISFNDRDSIFAILRELWFDIQPVFSKELLENMNTDKSILWLNKMATCYALTGFENISDFFISLISRLEMLKNLNNHQINNGCAILFIVQENILGQLNQDLTHRTIRKELNKFDDIFTKAIPFNDSESLLSILIEFERYNLDRFQNSLNQIINSKDQPEIDNQNKHFSRLDKNISLIGLDKLRVFPELMIDIFDIKTFERFDDNIKHELYQSYKLFVDNLENEKTDADVTELVSTLKEVMSEISIKEEQDKTADRDVENEIPEEDLDQIFNDEAKNYIWKIEDALALIEADPGHTKPFEEIEKNAHSLKASARLMGYEGVTEICGKIENIAVYYLHNKFPFETEISDTIKTSVNAITEFIDGDEKNISKSISELKFQEEKLKAGLESQTAEEQDKKQDEIEREETPLFVDSDQDDELLDIFKEESLSFIDTIDKAINNLKKGEENTEEIHQFEYASHSLKSAAKMLGFREIGQISDGLEQIAESLYKKEIFSEANLVSVLENAIKAIKSLSEGEKVPGENISDIINQLDLNKIKENQRLNEDITKKAQTTNREIDPMVDLFLKEAWEMLEKINRDLVQFESKHDSAILENLNRNVHTLKGSAQMMQFEKIGHIAHIVEDFLEKQIENKDTIPDDYLQPIFNAFDEIQNIMESIKIGKGEVSNNYDNILNQLGIFETEISKKEVEDEKDEIIEDTTISTIAEPVKQSFSVLPETSKEPKKDAEVQHIKITTDRLDSLINMAAELVINKTQLTNYVDSLKKLGLDLDKDRKILKDAEYSLDDIILKRKYEQDLSKSKFEEVSQGQKANDLALISNDFKKTINTIDLVSSKFNTLTHGFEQNIGRLAHLIKMLHDDVLQVRMVPVENLFNRFPRAVRDLAKKQKKKVDLQIEGTDTEMDRAMIESLTDPLMHIVRNSIDHGIELPMHRKRAGKNNAGKLILRAKQDKNQIIIEVEDDGKGIDVAAVKSTIIKKKLLTKEEANKLSTGEVLDYIFYPGFSTKKSTSKVSGRGIGLDVVASQVQKLKGDIRVNSTVSQGTVFSIRVPLTLVISQAMLFKLTDQILAVPLISVDKSIQFNKNAIKYDNAYMYINYKNEQIPTINLNTILKFSDADLNDELKAIIIQETDVKCALIVDEVLYREEIVIKSLGTHLQNLEYISGGTILGDGTVALILDTSAIIRKIEKDFLKKEKATVIEKKKKEVDTKTREVERIIKRKEIKNRKAVALIVDDSISVRRFVASVLEKNNFETVLASDGINALEDLKEKSFDILITDLEMPKMHGYELIEKVRKQKKYQDLPIVILTGRAGKKHKDMGIKLGANAFIVKPFKDNDLLSTLKKFIDN